jgi:uncharacterized protein
MRDAEYWIVKLGLEPHPEGGYFRQTYKSELMIVPGVPGRALTESKKRHSQSPHSKIAKGAILEWGTERFSSARAASTAIYFLLKEGNFSALHRLRSDEMWHFYAGSPLAVHVIARDGEYSPIRLGRDPDRGEVFQAVVKAGCWFGAEIGRDSHVTQNRRDMGHPAYALVGCTVAPGFEFEDFELAKRDELSARYPQQRELIERLTRE